MLNDFNTAKNRTLSWRIFRPILAGATLGDRLLASFAALVGISLTGAISALVLGKGIHLIMLVPPMGAAAVLVFAVPASPLAQPWPTIGGNIVSALVGIIAGRLISDPALAAGCAVGGAIALMSVLRCLHPPGGAAALVGVFGGPAVTSAGFLFPIIPVGLNAVLLVSAAWLFHRFSGHAYPHVPLAAPTETTNPPSPGRGSFTTEDIERALRNFGEPLDISVDDLERLIRAVETEAAKRETTSPVLDQVSPR